MAVELNRIRMVEILIDYADIQIRDIKGKTMFHLTASTSLKMISLLIEKSIADLNSNNADGYTPLNMACLSKNSTKKIKVLRIYYELVD